MTSELYPLLCRAAGEENILPGAPLSEHTSFKIGGPCRFLALPRSVHALSEIVRAAKERGVPYFLMGGGTNLLCCDRGYDGIVIRTSGLDCVRANEGKIFAQSGASLARAALCAVRAGLAGLEFAHGIPGSVGGGIVMNAGAYGGEIAGCLEFCEYLDGDGNIHAIPREECAFSYRRSFFSSRPELTVLSGTFALSPGDPEKIRECMRELAGRRKRSQPLEMPSAGSVFKRPPGGFAGTMIQECGLKGLTVGGAMVSTKHAGFIVNAGGARAADVLELIGIIRERVFARFGVRLECELRLLAPDGLREIE